MEDVQPIYRHKLPDDDVIYVLGIVSIITSFIVPIISLIPSFVGMAMASSAMRAYNENPTAYDINSHERVLRGKRLCKVGIYCTIAVSVLAVIAVIFLAAIVFGFGAALF